MSLGRPDTSGIGHIAPPIALGRASALRRLLGSELVGAIQVGHDYPGRIVIDDAALALHFAGEIALALRVGNGKGRSRLLVFDVDARAPERIPLVCDALRSRGYGHAVVTTGGSTPERGKVAIFFRSEQQNAALRVLGAELLRAIRLIASWGVETTAHEVTLYPSRGEGGLVRLGGRNIARNGPLEDLSNAWGEPCDLSDVAPIPTSLRAVRDLAAPVRTSPRQPWVERAMREGLTWIAVGGTRGINAFANRLARETIRTHGNGDSGRTEYRRVLEAVAAASPDLLRPSPKNRDRRHPLGWGRRASSAWERNCADATRADTTSSPAKYVESATAAARYVVSAVESVQGDSQASPSTRGRRLSYVILETVALLATIVKRRGLNPIAFEVSYREGAAMLGLAPESFRRRILRAEGCGLLIRVDPGLQGSGGRYTGRPGGGAKTLYALVPAGETPEGIRAKAEAHHAVIRRRAFVRSEQQRLEKLQRDTQTTTTLVMLPNNIEHAQAPASKSPSMRDEQEPSPSRGGRKRRADHARSTPTRTIAEIQQRIRAIATEHNE